MESDVVPSEPPLYDVRAQNPGKTDSEIQEIYIYGAGLRSLRCIVGLSRFKNLQFLSLHNNEITNIEGLELLPSLKELNLSSNNITIMEGLSHLSSLKVLNLSCNRIREISGLEGLYSLCKLVLSHNYVVKLGGISALHGPRYSLKYLDLKDNFIKSLAELWQLAGCTHLEELVLSQGKHTNPVCQEAAYLSTLVAALPHLKYSDGEPLPVPKVQPLPTKAMVDYVTMSPGNFQLPAVHVPAARDGTGIEKIQFNKPSLAHQVDHALKGFVRRRNIHQSSTEGTLNPVPKDDHEIRLGLLESRFSELVDNIKSLNVRSEGSEDVTEEANGGSHSKFRSKKEKRRHLVGRSKRGSKRRKEDSFTDDDLVSEEERLPPTKTSIVVEDHTLEQICSEISHLQLELANVKEELLKKNSPRMNALQPNNVAANGRMDSKETSCSEKGSANPSISPTFGKENAWKLEKALKEKDAELQRMRESAAYMEFLLKTEKCPPAVTIREQIKAKLFSIQAETAALKEALDVANCLRQNAERALMDVTAERETLRQSEANLAKALDEKHANLRICNTELESCKRKEIEAHEEVRRLSTLLATERIERKNEIEHLTSVHERNLKAAVERESAAAERRGRGYGEKALESLQTKLKSTERELQQAIEDCKRSMERMSRIQEEAQQESAELRQALKTVEQKEQDAQALVAELTAVVQSQKLKLKAVQLELGKSSAAQEELQALKLEATTWAAKTAGLVQEVESLRQQLAEASRVGDLERWKQESSFNTQLQSLKHENEKLSGQLATTLEKLQTSDDTIRIKTKMLDSQNDSIKELKLELARSKDALKEAKSSTDSIENEWNARFRDEVEQGRALRKELAAQDAVIAELEEELKLQKAACLTAEHDYSTLQQKLKEKDEMLRYVKGEINQVKSLYENREKMISVERDQAVEKLKVAILEKQNACLKALEAQGQLDQINAMKMEFEKKEREYVVTLKRKDEELEESSRKLLHMENEWKERLLCMERQKAISSSKVNQLCKVLDELRAAS